jgi:hypothetical protein
MRDELDDETEARLISHYDSPVPADFAGNLQQRLRRQTKPHGRTWRWGTAGAAFAAVIALAVVVVRPWDTTGGSSPHSTQAKGGRAIGANASTSSSDTPTGALSFVGGYPSLETQVAMATLIVRARIMGFEETTVRYSVERTIYGTPPTDNVLHLAKLPSDRFPNPSIEDGKELLLLLSRRDNVAYVFGGRIFNVPPEGTPDASEQEIVRIVRSGDYLENPAIVRGDDYPGMTGFGDPLAAQSRSLVRARLLEVDDKAARWQVEKFLRGKNITSATIEIPHDLFRLRAQAVVNFAALKDEALKDPARREARIAQETQALIAAELSPGHEAILLLGKIEQTGETSRAELLFRLYDTSTRMKLDEFEKLIASPQSTRSPPW